MENKKIEYKLDEKEKDKMRARLEEIMNKKEGTQCIILMDENKVSDYYQNACGPCLLSKIEYSMRHYSAASNNILVAFPEEKDSAGPNFIIQESEDDN